jgi:hypothetical protein
MCFLLWPLFCLSWIRIHISLNVNANLKGCLEAGEVGHEGGLLQLQLPQLALQLRGAAGLLRLAVQAVQVLLVFLTQRKTTRCKSININF